MNLLLICIHFIHSLVAQLLSIYVGSTDLKGNGTYYKVDKFIYHEEYNRPQFAYDIAVIRVKEPIVFTDNVQPIELSSEEVPDDTVLQLTGWGALQVSLMNKFFFCESIQDTNRNRFGVQRHNICKSSN